MKESVGAFGITNIVIVFIFLFSGYLAISINQTKAYNVKNEVINIIQKHNGLNDQTLAEIREYMTDVGYRSTGSCDFETEGTGYTQTSAGEQSKAIFCIKAFDATEGLSDNAKAQFPTARYYKVRVFFSLDLPILRNAFRFSLVGETRTIYYPIEG